MTGIKLKELIGTVNKLKKEGKKIVFTNGCFDIIHIGHVRYLKEAKKLGDILIVGINGDESVKTLKGEGRPIIPEKERAEILSSIKWVDYVVIFYEINPESLITKIKPDIHVKGGDYMMDEIPESKLVKSLGGKTVIIKEIEKKSTSDIVQRILKLPEDGR